VTRRREKRKDPSGATVTCASNQASPHASWARPPMRALPSGATRAHIHVGWFVRGAKPPPP
jgi:hypothetical protein